MIQTNVPLKSTSSQQDKIRFSPNADFERELKKRVQQYFDQTGLPKRDCPKMYFKTSLILIWAILSYSLLVFSNFPPWGILLSAISLTMSLNAIGFNLMHDGVHRAYSNRPVINKLMGLSMDLIGGSSYFWYWKHNYLHHSYPNITGHDDDIEAGILARFSPHQKRYFFHRYQHIYIWFLYGFLAIKWHLFDDFYTFYTKRINEHPIDRPEGWDFLIFFGGKLCFFSLAFIIPSFFYPITYVLLFYAFIAFLQGVQMSVILQLAHCNQDAEFPMHSKDSKTMGTTWIVHQLSTTADYARNNSILNWYVGGLNFQVEHHLFPTICHINYPAISIIVAKTCKEYKVAYFAYDSFASGLRSHYEWLRYLGQSETT